MCNISSTEKVPSDSLNTCPDMSRFPVISNNNIEELKPMAVNKNTSHSTKQRPPVFDLDIKMLTQFSTVLDILRGSETER